MDNLDKIISENLKSIRIEKNLTLGNLSKLTDINENILEQIERGEVSPNLSTVWKIVNGLKVSFTSLISEYNGETILVKNEFQKPIVADDGKYLAYPLFHYDNVKRFEVFKIDIEKNGKLNSEPHPSGTYEYITVFSGKLMILVGGEKFSISKGEAIKFKADRKHTYHNVSDEMVSISMVIYYAD